MEGLTPGLGTAPGLVALDSPALGKVTHLDDLGGGLALEVDVLGEGRLATILPSLLASAGVVVCLAGDAGQAEDSCTEQAKESDGLHSSR